MKILNFGSLNLDYIYSVSHFPRPGETLASDSLEVRPGGKGLNQSIALARAGVRNVFHAGLYGTGGENLPLLLSENGIDTRFLLKTDAIQGNAVIEIAPTGENRILLFGGSNREISSGQIDDTLGSFGSGDLLLLQNEISLLPEIIDRAWERGMQIILNPSPCDDTLGKTDFGKLSWIFINEIEAETLFGTADPEAVFEAVRKKYPSLSVLVTLGEKGSCAMQIREGKAEYARADAVKAETVDTTAAGDTYTGYFIAGLLAGKPLRECMLLASLAAAVSTESPGAADSIPLLADLEGAGAPKF